MASCTKVARGIANPACVPPYQAPATPSAPFADVTDSNPCNEYIVSTVGGVDFSAHNCCWPHLVMKLGFASLPSGPIVFAP